MNRKACPCGSGNPFADCCEPFLLGAEEAETAESLMRSRYSAYVEGNEPYLLHTWHENTRPQSISLDLNGTWLPLRILNVVAGGKDDNEGIVEFSTGYQEKGRVVPLHERSRFVKQKGRWLYLDGIFEKESGTPVKEKAGRNDPCPCGSGRKYKKCCG